MGGGAPISRRRHMHGVNLMRNLTRYLCMGHWYLNLSKPSMSERGVQSDIDTWITHEHINYQSFVSKIANHRNNFIISCEHFNSPWSKRQVRYKLWLASLAIKLTNSYAQATHITLNSHILLAAYNCYCPLGLVAWFLLWVQEVRGHRFDHEP